MKHTAKKLLSFALAAFTVLNSAALVVANAEHIEEKLEFYYLETDVPSEYGYIDSRFVDENGNEIAFEEPEEFEFFCNSAYAAPLPTAFDARDEGFVTSVKSQGSTNNCWVFSAISALESDSIAGGFTEKDSTDFSEAHLSWFASRPVTEDESDISGREGTNNESPYLQGGNWRIATAALARRSGVASESEFPFYSKSIDAMGNYDEADRYNTGSGVILDSAQELTDADEVKKWITEHGNVSAAFYYDDDYYTANNAAYFCDISGKTNHQINIIGWDDSYPAENFANNEIPAGDGAWLCRNSWGNNWGEDGYFRISYYDTSLSGFIGFTVASADNYYNNYSYNGIGWSTAVYTGASELAAANVFTSDGYEKITSVSTYTVNPDTYVTVKIYKNLPENYSKPSEGTLAATFGSSLDNSGYHTLHLNNAVNVEPGEIFSVAVYYYNSNVTVKLPFEKDSTKTAYHSNKGESYVLFSTSSNNWINSGSYKLDNAVIQASTECTHNETESTVTAEATCSSAGTLSDICTQCGKTTGTKCISATEHTYGEWTEFEHNDENNTEISHRECTVCGDVQSRSYGSSDNSGTKTVSLNDFLSIFFAKFFEIFRLF